MTNGVCARLTRLLFSWSAPASRATAAIGSAALIRSAAVAAEPAGVRLGALVLGECQASASRWNSCVSGIAETVDAAIGRQGAGAAAKAVPRLPAAMPPALPPAVSGARRDFLAGGGLSFGKEAAAPAALKRYKPTTPGFRFRVITSRVGLHKGAPYKPLTVGLRKTGGRNAVTGRITCRHIGGGHKRTYRIIDFHRKPVPGGHPARVTPAPSAASSPAVLDSGTVPPASSPPSVVDAAGKVTVSGIVRRLEYDPNRSCRIALVDYPPSVEAPHRPRVRYILAPEGLLPGATVASGPGAAIFPGNALPLWAMPVGTTIHNVELTPGLGGQLCRSAGCGAMLIRKGGDGKALIKLPSGEQRLVQDTCMATVGALGNKEHMNRSLGKAGASRWAGIRPSVRGVAMNPVDHPMGGGEGKTSGGRPSCSPWGVYTKGQRTRSNKRTEMYIRTSRHEARGRGYKRKA